jgi:RNA polymerase sigma factor (TIGR02999 family)
MSELTPILDLLELSDPAAFLPLVYDELRRLAAIKLRQEPAGQTLQATALVHEVWLRLTDRATQQWNGRGHFFGAAAEAMRRILIEQARHKQSAKAGGKWQRQDEPLEQIAAPASAVDPVALSDALDQLAQKAPRAAEVVKLRYFIGLTLREISEVLDIAESTADADWAYARSWLRVQLADREDDSPEVGSIPNAPF